MLELGADLSSLLGDDLIGSLVHLTQCGLCLLPDRTLLVTRVCHSLGGSGFNFRLSPLGLQWRPTTHSAGDGGDRPPKLCTNKPRVTNSPWRRPNFLLDHGVSVELVVELAGDLLWVEPRQVRQSVGLLGPHPEA